LQPYYGRQEFVPDGDPHLAEGVTLPYDSSFEEWEAFGFLYCLYIAQQRTIARASFIRALRYLRDEIANVKGGRIGE
jgi:hypothetical protein